MPCVTGLTADELSRTDAGNIVFLAAGGSGGTVAESERDGLRPAACRREIFVLLGPTGNQRSVALRFCIHLASWFFHHETSKCTAI